MLRTLVLTAAFALAATASFAGNGGGPPYTTDAKGKCHGAKAYAEASFCKADAPAAAGAPNCKKGKPCGKSCIAQDKVCHIK